MRSRYKGGLLEGIARDHARQMRANQTNAERLLWFRLRRKNINARFRRQHLLYGFIVDFCCIEHHLVIELAGDSHAETVAYDAWRTEQLSKRGFRVLRFFNEEVQNNLEGVIEAIWQAMQTTPPSPSPVSDNGGGDESKANH
jgi:very-short-patch-repair endonuclease